jgi:hypothetical protein
LPALVAFFMTGSNGNFTGNSYGGYGNIGWVPLAPGEPYQPWYSGYGGQQMYPPTNVTYVTNVYYVYRNFRYIRGIRMYPLDRFRDGQWNKPIVMRPDQVRRIVVIRGAVPVAPGRGVLRYGPISGPIRLRPIQMSPQFAQPRFAAKTPVVIPFERQQAQMKTISDTHPKVVTAPVHPPLVTAPVHPPLVMHPDSRPPAVPQPAAHAVVPVHVVAPVQRPVERPMAPIHTMAPIPHHAAPPAALPVTPAVHPQTAPLPPRNGNVSRPAPTKSPKKGATPPPQM